MFSVITTYPPCLVNSQDGISLCPVRSIQHFLLANNRGRWIEAMVEWLSVITVSSALPKNPRTSLPHWTDNFMGIEASYSSRYYSTTNLRDVAATRLRCSLKSKRSTAPSRGCILPTESDGASRPKTLPIGREANGFHFLSRSKHFRVLSYAQLIPGHRYPIARYGHIKQTPHCGAKSYTPSSSGRTASLDGCSIGSAVGFSSASVASWRQSSQLSISNDDFQPSWSMNPSGYRIATEVPCISFVRLYGHFDLGWGLQCLLGQAMPDGGL